MDNQKKIEEGPERAPLSTEDLAEWKGMCFQAEMFPGGHAVSVLFLASRTAMPKLIAEVERLSSARTHDCNVLNLLIDDERALRQIAEERAEKAEAALAETKKENERILVEVDRWVREKDAEIARLHAEVLHMMEIPTRIRKCGSTRLSPPTPGKPCWRGWRSWRKWLKRREESRSQVVLDFQKLNRPSPSSTGRRGRCLDGS